MIIDEIVGRRAVRRYDDRRLPEDAFRRILEAGRLAPSARNAQDWRIVVVRDPALRDRLVEAASPHQAWLKTAPVLLVACGLDPDYVMRCGQPAYPIDLAIVLDHISLQAVAEGMGTCWIGSFYEGPAREVLGIPDRIRLVQIMSLGYPLDTPGPTPRKSFDRLYAFDGWVAGR